MSRVRRPEILRVYLNGRLVGNLQRTKQGAIDFRYDATWLQWPSTFPISLSLPLREERHSGPRVTAVFENLLPDEPAVRRQIATRMRAAGTDAFSLLSVIGRDCVGALQFLPEDITPGSSDRIDARALSETEIERILSGLARDPLGLDPSAEFRISLAGAQEKTALLWWNDAWHLPNGTTATTHILKPAIGMRSDGIDLSDSVENEHLCLRILDALGLPVARSRVEQFGSRVVLVVERFDRLWTSEGLLLRLPQEDFCQALGVPSDLKYESDGGPGLVQILHTLRASDDPGADQRTLMKAVIVYWLLAATDAHAKNFSIALRPGGGFRSTPLYDVVSLQPLLDRGRLRLGQMKFALAIGDRRHYRIDKISGRHFEQSAGAAGLPLGTIREIAAELVEGSESALIGVEGDLPHDFPQELKDSIFAGFRSRLGSLRRWLDSRAG